MTETKSLRPASAPRRHRHYSPICPAAQVESHRESTARQYALAEQALEFGWKPDRVTGQSIRISVLSCAGTVQRSGFAQLTTEVALGHVGIVLGLEVSRLARNNAEDSIVYLTCVR